MFYFTLWPGAGAGTITGRLGRVPLTFAGLFANRALIRGDKLFLQEV